MLWGERQERSGDPREKNQAVEISTKEVCQW